MKKAGLFFFILISTTFYSQKKWSLQECVSYAVAHNLQVIQNQNSKKTQDNNLQIAKREYLPSISGTITNTANFGQGQDVFGNIKRNDNFSNNANLGANFLLYNNGRLDKNIKKTTLDVQASAFDIETIKNNISLQIAEQYLSVLLNKELVKIAQSSLDNADKVFKRAKITTNVGTTPQTTLAEATAGLAREKQNQKTTEINTERSLFALAQLLQLPNYKEFDVQEISVSEEINPINFSTDDVLQKAFENQPQIKAAETRIKSAVLQTEVTKTGFWPTISASAGIGTFYYNSLVTNTIGFDALGNPISEKGFFNQYKNNFGQQLGLSANIPVFNKGITKLQVQQSKINEEIAKNTLEQEKQAIKQSVQKSQFDAEANYEIYLAAMESEKSTKLALGFAEKSYDAGRSTIYDLTNTRNNYVNAQGSVAQAKYNYLFSVKLLNFYSGIPLTL